MPELIDKQKAQTEIALIAKHLARSDAQKAIIGRILFMLDQMPTIEPEVRHGRWIIKPHGSYGQMRAFCSACGKHSGIGGIESNQRKPFCPNCGADMRGVIEDETN